MKSELISIKKMAIPFLSLVIASQAAGCGSTNQADMQNTEVVLELPDLGKLELTPEERSRLDEIGIDWEDSPAPIYMVDWDYETDWKEILKLSNDDYQLELQYCEEKCPEKVMLASYLEGYFNWKDEYVKNQVKSEDSKPISTEKPVVQQPQTSKPQSNTNSKPQTSKPTSQQSSNKPQTQTSKPSGSGGSGVVDIQSITSGNVEYVHEELNPDGTTPGELTDPGSGDLSGITVE